MAGTITVSALAPGLPVLITCRGLQAAGVILSSTRDYSPSAPSAGGAGIVTYYAGFAAMLLGMTLFLTQAWRYSVLQAAAGIIPGPITAAIGAPFSGIVSARLGTRTTVLAGAALFAVASAWPLAVATQSASYVVVVLPCVLLWAVANALIQPTLFAVANSVPRAGLASGSAVLATARQIGSALGVAILVAALGSHPARTAAGRGQTPPLQR